MQNNQIRKTWNTRKGMFGIGLFGLVLLFSSCSGADKGNVRVTDKISLDSLPGASGIGMQQGNFWIIGDDARTCMLFDKNFDLKDTVSIPSMLGIRSNNGRVPKDLKADLEALVVVNDFEVLALGSGSRPTREIAVRISGKGSYSIEEFTLHKFYQSLRSLAEMKNVELNIEAAAILGDYLYLFNRTNGLMVSLHYRDFMHHITEGAPLPKLNVRKLNLPVFNGIKAGISGASFDRGSGRLIITASLELTNDAYNDGEILGSYIGSISVPDLEDEEGEIIWTEIPNDGEVMKIESVEVVEYHEKDGYYDLVMTVDNDNGRSHVLRVEYQPGN